MMELLLEAGEEFDAVPYGTEALGVMRIEKGHAAGNELNGTTTALNLGMGKMVSKKKDCIGNIMSERAGLNEEDALMLVGFKPVRNTDQVVAGSHLMNATGEVNAKTDQGYITSAAYSPTLGSSIGIGFLKSGGARKGEVIRAVNPLEGKEIKVEVVSAHFVDPEGERLRA
jgi:sarcosine oxidase subunit alpha